MYILLENMYILLERYIREYVHISHYLFPV